MPPVFSPTELLRLLLECDTREWEAQFSPPLALLWLRRLYLRTDRPDLRAIHRRLNGTWTLEAEESRRQIEQTQPEQLHEDEESPLGLLVRERLRQPDLLHWRAPLRSGPRARRTRRRLVSPPPLVSRAVLRH